jgi:hypothetical protein
MSEGTRRIDLGAAHAFVRQKLLPRWETNGWEPHDGSFASQKLCNQKSSPVKPHSRKSTVSGSQSRNSNSMRKPLASEDAEMPSVPRDSLSTNFHLLEWEIMYTRFVVSELFVNQDPARD